MKFPKTPFLEFPQRQVVHNPEDIQMRRELLQTYLQDIVTKPLIVNSWELQYFLEIRKHVNKESQGKILMPLPDKDFDPTESSVPWKILWLDGWDFVFATEKGTKAEADPMLVKPQGFIQNQVAAAFEARQFYHEMEQDPNFINPITWDSINPSDYDAMILPGGHAPGMKQYLESEVLQKKIVEFWHLDRPLAAICHGVLLLARCKDESTGNSVIYKKRTTTLPKYMENLGYYITKWSYGRLYRTYEMHCEDEVKSFLADPVSQMQDGPTNILRGSIFDHSAAFVVEDGNYISARWPGDAYLFGIKLLEKLYAIKEGLAASKENAEPNEESLLDNRKSFSGEVIHDI